MDSEARRDFPRKILRDAVIGKQVSDALFELSRIRRVQIDMMTKPRKALAHLHDVYGVGEARWNARG